MLSRRQFLWQSSAALATTAFLPPFLAKAAQSTQLSAGHRSGTQDHILLVIEMTGGNDGLNTVVPYGLDGYRQARPTLGIRESDVLPLTDHIGLHPELGKLAELYRAGDLAVVQGAGYPNPSLSHFRSMDIWHTAAPDSYATSGWLAEFLSSTSADDANETYAASVTNGIARALYGNAVSVPVIASLQAYQYRTDPRYQDDRARRLACANVIYGESYSSGEQTAIAHTASTAIASSERVQSQASAYTTTVDYPRSTLGNNLKTIAQLLAGGLGTHIFYTSFGGFDTHAGQAPRHTALLRGLSASVDAFLNDLGRIGQRDNVLIITFSEFGRRVQQNGSNGTDHGTAGPMFVIGSQVNGGLYGEHPSLENLDQNGNLRYGIDFRAVYGTVIEGWLGSSQQAVLGRSYENVGFL